ncbi:MAG: ATP-binding protein [Desulfobacterales bacterium]
MTKNAEYPSEDAPRVLVVDDEARIRSACQLVLEESGYAVSLAADGEKGLAQLGAEHFDIILLDLMMPTLSGFEVLAEVKSIHPDTVVIVITGYATLEHSVEAMKQGAFDFIPKPFTPEHLRVVVAKALTHIQALNDIAETHSRIRTMVNRLADGVLCTNHEGRVVLANPAFLRMVGRPAESVEGVLVEEIVNFEQLREMIATAQTMAPDILGEQTAEFTSGVGHDEAEDLVISARSVPFRDRRGRSLGVITVLHDITALKRMDRMKSEFVSMVSHEIRGPMNSVQMQLQVVLEGLAGELTEKQRDILERAVAKIVNLGQMTTELLDLSRIESGLISQEREQVDMAELIREQVAFHGPRADSAGHQLKLDLPDNLPPLLAHRRNMEEILSNLITNAIKYTLPGGTILISARAKGDNLCIAVQDSGLGIAPEDQKRIFQRFYRIKARGTRHIQGTGLGLSLVKKIVDAHHGRIRVESRPGAGSTFIVDLPLSNGADPGPR